MTNDELKNDPEILGAKMFLMRLLKSAQEAGNAVWVRKLKAGIAALNNPTTGE